MARRNPKLNPVAGDVLAREGWTVTVTGVEGDKISVQARKLEGRKTFDRSLENWRKWAKGARIKEREPEPGTCTKMWAACGPCNEDRELIEGDVHIVDLTFFCEKHCPVHGVRVEETW